MKIPISSVGLSSERMEFVRIAMMFCLDVGVNRYRNEFRQTYSNTSLAIYIYVHDQLLLLLERRGGGARAMDGYLEHDWGDTCFKEQVVLAPNPSTIVSICRVYLTNI